MFKISKLVDYSCIVLSLLFRESGASMSSSELAEKSRIGHASVSKVLKLLNEASLIESARGAKGGYRVMLSQIGRAHV